LGIIVNRRDPLSVKIGQYYQKKRAIPRENLINIEFDPKRSAISPTEFQRLKEVVDAKTPARVQAFALTWASPYRVGCMSITSAFTFGFDAAYCANGCAPTQANPYFNSNSPHPYDDFQVRPTMAIAAKTMEAAEALIARGVVADGSRPRGTAYLLSTRDAARNVRAKFYPEVMQQLASYFAIKIIKGNALEGKPDVMFYFTGSAQVEKLATNQFLPGAIADHLTSFGGQLTDSGQMSSLRWLEAGATGSYGTVVEPCNFPQKFPHPGVLIYHYLRGETLIEAYWKSVAWPGQGLFIGEPLARPFGG
jgi:uncharacterized protein (TIGR03790 family)